jgi:Mg-chelatase subunit ChlD
VASVLVLDMSSSLSYVLDDLKKFAKNHVDEVSSSIDNAQVAVVFFTGSADIVTTAFNDNSSIEDLKSHIDNFEDFKDRTALFAATLIGIDMLNNLGSFEGAQTLVVLTDGKDNDNPSDKLESIEDSKVEI